MEEERPGASDAPIGFARPPNPARGPIMAESFEAANAAIILPTLNEEGGLSQTLLDIPFERLAGAGWRVRPLVIDGGSTDRTLEVAAAWGLTVIHQKSRGKGGAVREALEWLAARKVQYAVVLDADASYPGASVLPALELLDAGSHLVVGVRQSAFGPPVSARDLVHRVGNALLNFAAGQFSRASILDVCSGFWGVRVARSQELELVSNDFGIEAELFLKAHRADWTVQQIPIPYRERVGVAKLHAVSDGIRILLSIIRFGHRTLKAAPPATSLLPAFIRELLVTALVGGGELVLVTPPSREDEARAVAFLLERSDLKPRVVVRPETTPAPPAAVEEARPHRRRRRNSTPRASRSEPAPLGKDDTLIGPVIRFGRARRVLYVDMPEVTPFSPPRPMGSSRASLGGAYLARPRTPGDILDPIRQLARRLNGDAYGMRNRFLEANGLSLQGVYDGPAEMAEAAPESISTVLNRPDDPFSEPA